MNAITLYTEDMNTPVKELHPLQRERLIAAIAHAAAGDHRASEGLTTETLDAMTLVDALKLAGTEQKVYWVSKNRDLSQVDPLSTPFPYFAYDRQVMQPLLDALEKGDFELAEALTPRKYRLCGYNEYTEPKTEGEYGIGWAGQFAEIVVPPGVYPVFAREFQYNEAKHCYTNHLRDYPGFFTWVEGQCVASSYNQDKFPYPRTLITTPYCHSVAHSILDGEGSIHLIYPFKAVEVPFTSIIDGKSYVTYDIIDSRLPELVQCNPMNLRGFGPVEGEKAKSLAEQISSAEKRTEQQSDKAASSMEKGR